MDDIIKDIQKDILNPDISLASILLKAKVLAYKLKNDDLKKWVKNELDGYGDEDTLPDYRVLRAESLGKLSNGSLIFPHYPIPMSTVPDILREQVGRIRIYAGISEIEIMAGKKALSSPWPIDWIGIYNLENNNEPNWLINAYRPISVGSFAQILQTVRSRLQDFILEISDLPWDSGQEPPADQIKNIFQVTINNSLEGGNMSIFDQRGQNVQNQYNAGHDVNVGTIQNHTEFVEKLENLKSEVAKAGEAKVINEDAVIDIDYQIKKAIQESRKSEPKKLTIVDHITKAKSIVDGFSAATGLTTSLTKLIEVANSLF